MRPIITSLFENDFYKYPMGKLVLHRFPEVEVRCELNMRNKVAFPKGSGAYLREQVDTMSDLAATPEEMTFLRKRAGFLGDFYLDWQSHFRFDPSEVCIEQSGDDLRVVYQPPWYRGIYWEVPLMGTICQSYHQLMNQRPIDGWQEKVLAKAKILYDNNINWADFSMRRAQSRALNEEALLLAMQYQQKGDRPGGLVGTSCVSLAAKYGLRPIGTMAHELVMVFGAIFGYPIANTMMMSTWMPEFDGALGTVLPDGLTVDFFLRDFTAQYAKAFDGARHDSGDPIEFAKKFIAHYQSLGIDPRAKTLIFSDSLDLETILRIAEFCEGKIGYSIGWGGKFYGSEVGITPLNCVIKPTAARLTSRHPWLPAVKIPDNPAKISNEEVARAVMLLLGLN